MNNAMVHIIVSGSVQGVYFRANTRRQAKAFGLNGWVRNKSEGTVEIVAEGEKAKIEKLITWCHRGPPGAIVKDVVVKWEEFTGDFKDFNVRY